MTKRLVLLFFLLKLNLIFASSSLSSVLLSSSKSSSSKMPTVYNPIISYTKNSNGSANIIYSKNKVNLYCYPDGTAFLITNNTRLITNITRGKPEYHEFIYDGPINYKDQILLLNEAAKLRQGAATGEHILDCFKK